MKRIKKINTSLKPTLHSLRSHLGIFMMMALIIPTIAVSQISPAPVDLGTSGDFVILAKSGISTTGTTSIVGDIGVSPIAAVGITGFGLIMDSSGQFATTPIVTGKVFAADYANPTPSMLTTAVSDMETAYTNAAGRAADYTNLHAGDITGQTLTTGVYKWETGVLVSAGGVTISGSPTDVFIFQIAGNLTIANGAAITLIGGVKPSNIFWQMAGQTTLGTYSDFSGIILGKTAIVMQTGASFNGRALSQTAVTLDSNNIVIADEDIVCTVPGNTIAPAQPTHVGVTTLNRNVNNWLSDENQNKKGVNLMLESSAKPFVITRVVNISAITSPIEGMLVWERRTNRLMLYKQSGWSTISEGCNTPVTR